MEHFQSFGEAIPDNYREKCQDDFIIFQQTYWHEKLA